MVETPEFETHDIFAQAPFRNHTFCFYSSRLEVMFILVLKQDGLLPVVKQTGEIVDVGLLGAIPCRAPTYEELSENLTIPQVKNR